VTQSGTLAGCGGCASNAATAATMTFSASLRSLTDFARAMGDRGVHKQHTRIRWLQCARESIACRRDKILVTGAHPPELHTVRRASHRDESCSHASAPRRAPCPLRRLQSRGRMTRAGFILLPENFRELPLSVSEVILKGALPRVVYETLRCLHVECERARISGV